MGRCWVARGSSLSQTVHPPVSTVADLGALLAAYPLLPPDERAAVDALAADQPDWHEAHADARRLAALVDAASGLTSAPGLAQIAAARRLGADPPEGARADRDRAADPDLAREADAIDARLDRQAAEAEHPAAQFERLFGYPLPDLSPPEDRRASVAPSPPPRRLRWIAVVVVLALGYGAAWAVSAARATDREQVADLGAIDTRPLPPAGKRADSLGRALAAVARARRSTLLLFPRYDAAALDRAAAEMATQADAFEASSWPSQEARLALARVHLYRQRDVEAARVLGALVHEGGYRAPAARRMLDFLRSQDTT